MKNCIKNAVLLSLLCSFISAIVQFFKYFGTWGILDFIKIFIIIFILTTIISVPCFLLWYFLRKL